MKAILAILAFCIIGFFVYSAVKKEQPKPVKTGVVYYYPKANVYYDVASEQYIYFDSTQKNWKQSKKFSEEQKLSLGEKAVIKNPSSPVWKNNAQDRLIYSANLYSSTNDLQQKYRTDSINSLPKPVADTEKQIDSPQTKPEATTEEKHKSGIRKFFDKLFKGKKDKDS